MKLVFEGKSKEDGNALSLWEMINFILNNLFFLQSWVVMEWLLYWRLILYDVCQHDVLGHVWCCFLCSHPGWYTYGSRSIKSVWWCFYIKADPHCGLIKKVLICSFYLTAPSPQSFFTLLKDKNTLLVFDKNHHSLLHVFIIHPPNQQNPSFSSAFIVSFWFSLLMDASATPDT